MRWGVAILLAMVAVPAASQSAYGARNWLEANCGDYDQDHHLVIRRSGQDYEVELQYWPENAAQRTHSFRLSEVELDDPQSRWVIFNCKSGNECITSETRRPRSAGFRGRTTVRSRTFTPQGDVQCTSNEEANAMFQILIDRI